MGIFYVTRESVKQALDAAETARADWQVDEAIDAASRQIENETNRIFYPWTGTRYLDWPDPQNGTSYTLWLEENEVVSVDELRSGTAVIAPSAYNLEPSTQGPPFDHIELKLSGSASFGQSSSHQRDVTITGTFAGAPIDETAAGTLTAAIADTTTSPLSVSNPSALGIGSLIRIGTERLVITGRGWEDSGQEVTGSALTLSVAAQSLAVADGTLFVEGEVLLVDAEQLRVAAVAGNTLIVTRAWNGSVLAEHATSTPIYRSTQLHATRGVLGSVSTTHADGDAVYRWNPPAEIRRLARAQAIDTVLQEQGGYARTIGSGDNARNASGAALAALWSSVIDNYRRARLGVV